jgi:hypothetical protein
MTINARRRKILLTSVALLLSMRAATAQANRAAPPATEVDAALFAASVDFVMRRYVLQDRRVVYGRISRLQREFLLGYRSACELSAALEAANIWQVCGSGEDQFVVINLDSPCLVRGPKPKAPAANS